MFIIPLHFVNSAPNFLYSSNLLLRPSSPSVNFSPESLSNGIAPLSTFIPGIIPFSDKYFGKGIPSDVFCLIVSSYSMIPLINSLRFFGFK